MTGNALFDLAIIAAPLGFVAFWWTGSRARELAIEHARRSCQQEKVQFLDQSVALASLKIVRSEGGSAGIRRIYGFDFTDHIDHRDHGTVTMNGQTLVAVYMPYTRDEEGNRIYRH